MNQPWFTNTDASGEVNLTWREGSWFVKSPETDSEVKRLLEGDVELDPDESPVQLDGTVSKYMRGNGDAIDFLFLRPEGSDSTHESGTQPTKTKSEQSCSDSRSSAKATSSKSRSSSQTSNANSESSNQEWDLDEFSGSGNYVTVEAVVDSVHTVKKDTPQIPDMRGKLVDDSVREGVTFIVNDGVNHPYLEEGKRFEFSGVKDHYYTSNGEVQVMITQYTDFAEKEENSEPGSPESISYVSSTNVGSSSANTSKKTSDKSLSQIASDKIGEEELTETEGRKESAVGKAEKRAKDQQRDPAIDPRLQDNDDSEE